MNIKEVREKFPQYGDLSDQQLADALHTKFYADMPKEQFYSQVGLATTPPGATAAERGQAALGGANRGVAGLVGLPVDATENLINLGIAGAGSLATKLGRPDLAPDPLRGSVGGSEWVASILQRYGINTQNPRPDDAASRMLYTGGMIAASGGRPAVVPAIGGAVAGEVLGPEWTGVGAMTPAAAGQVGAAAKNAVASKVAPNVATFKEAGTTPSVGQATESSFLQGLENLAGKFPGGVGVMRKFVEAQQRSIGAKAQTGVSAEDAGRAIEKGVGDFLSRTKATWKQLDAEVAAKVPQGSTFAPANTTRALDELTATVPGADKTTASLVNPKLAEIKTNLQADLQANNGVLPFEAIRALRTKVGSMLDDSLVSGVPNGELKKVYGALSSDLEAAANAAGAGKEFTRQNNYYRSRMERVEGVLERVLGKNKQPEDVFKTFFPTDPDQANKVRAVMRSLDPAQRDVVTEAVVNRLGRATPGKQNEVGEVFSSETFLTNWNKLSDSAKAQLFPNHSTRQQVEAIAKASANIREGAKVFANPSGTAGAAAPYGLGAMVVTGQVVPAVGLVGGTYIGAKMLTSPKVVEWLAKPVNPQKPGEVQAHLARLGVIYNSADDSLKSELDQFIGQQQ